MREKVTHFNIVMSHTSRVTLEKKRFDFFFKFKSKFKSSFFQNSRLEFEKIIKITVKFTIDIS